MTYITGDCHGDFSRLTVFNAMTKLTEDDVMIILGDAGFNVCRDKREEVNKNFVNSFPFTAFCIHGNHEMRPYDIDTYKIKQYRGGTVWFEEEYPKILFAKDGEVYDFNGLKCMVIGGAYSVDKSFRLMYRLPWFENEQPSDEIKTYVEAQLEKYGNKIDIILSHTCPYKYEPKEVFIRGVNQLMVDKSTEKWLDEIEENTEYRKWYCGHYHTSKKIDKIQFMYEDIDVLSSK